MLRTIFMVCSGKFKAGAYCLLTFAIAVLCAFSMPLEAYALTAQQKAAIQSGARYFNTEEDNLATCGGSSLTGSENEGKVYNFLTQTKGLGPVQAAGIMGNLKEEAHYEPRLVEYGYKNSRGEVSAAGKPSSLDDAIPPDQPNIKDGRMKGQPGYGIVQWSGVRKPALQNFATSSEGAGRAVGDLSLQLDYLWHELTNGYKGVLTAIQAASTIETATRPFLYEFEKPGGPDAAFPRRVSNANEILTKYGGATPTAPTPAPTDPSATPTPTPVSSNGCSTSSGVVAGNIAQTAINLAWPDKGHDGTTADKAVPAYVTAHKDNPEAGNDYSDCGAFVSTVMRASGADPNYYPVGTTNQMDYLRTHTDKYLLFDNINSTSDLLPGDILIFSNNGATGHTYIYVGAAGGTFNSRGASLGGHVPQGSGAYFKSDSGQHFTVARLK